MAYFPGNIMVIDDQLPLIYKDVPEDGDLKNQYNALLDIKGFCENNGIPLITISETNDIGTLKTTIEKYQNVRMVIIDLDLNNDGNVNPEDDYETVFLILRTALKKFGYFMLLINSAHADAWDNIKKVMPEDINRGLISNLTYVFDKNSKEKAYNALDVIGKNYSAEVIYDFEVMLNAARDTAFSGFMDFEKNTWEKIYHTLHLETGEIAHNDISTILLGIIKQHLLATKYPAVKPDPKAEADKGIKKAIFKALNYSFNKEKVFDKQKIWTGNLYKTNLGHDREFALVINPECDLAQNKNLYIKVVFGFVRNANTLPTDYDPKNFTQKAPPLVAYRAGTTKTGAWKSYNDLKNVTKPNEHMFLLPFIAENDDDIFLDFRDISTFADPDVLKWNLILRVNEPYITNIIDTYSNLHNRKGLLPIL